MTSRGMPKWFVQWRAQQEEDAALAESDARWEDFLSERMNVGRFIRCLAIFRPFGSLTEYNCAEDDIRSGIMAAYAAREPWLRLDGQPPWVPTQGNAWLNLDPRAAALWLLSKPMYRHFVPIGLARVVLRDAREATPEERTASEKPTGRTRGPKPKKRERVAEAMRGMTRDKIGPEELRVMKQERMRVVFGASRETCVKAREVVLSEVVGVTNPAK